MISPVVLITGSSSGIGKALCQAFHRQGCRVVATARRVETLADLKDHSLMTLPLDVTDSTAIQQVVQTVLDRERRLDILVNNAGFGQFGPLMDISLQQMQDQFQTNVLAPLDLIQQVAPVMKRQQSGLIINLGSISGVVTTPFSGAYCASKSALHSLSDALRLELAPFGIQVMTVQPGAIQSNFGEAAAQSLTGVIAADSWYAPWEPVIRARAYLSQRDATPTHQFAQQLVAIALQPQPPAIVRLGKRSGWVPLLKQVLPTQVADFILRRKFGLMQIPDDLPS